MSGSFEWFGMAPGWLPRRGRRLQKSSEWDLLQFPVGEKNEKQVGLTTHGEGMGLSEEFRKRNRSGNDCSVLHRRPAQGSRRAGVLSSTANFNLEKRCTVHL